MHCPTLFLLFCAVPGILGMSIRSRRQTDECAPLNASPDQCSGYWSGQKPPILVISLDGFRIEYLNRTINVDGVQEPAAPNVNLLAKCGTYASSGMMPSFPTLTFPNHYSIVTGLYPESHGIVGNSFYDPDFGASFSLSSTQQTNPMWWGGEPLWYTAKRQGKISATYFWPGSDQTDPIREPNYWFKYDGSVPYTDRIEQVLKWLALPVSQRPNFITLYFDEPDHTGHGESPDSPLVNDMIKNVDGQIELLLNDLDTKGILGCIDLIVLADHGMAPSPPGEKFFLMENFVPGIGSAARIYDGVFPTIRPNVDTQEEQDRIAYGLECRNQTMRVYNKWELPRRNHYFKSNRIPSLLLDMTISWRAYVRSEYVLPGNHGWDNLNPQMQALFVAQGPSFKRNTLVRSFHNIELYNLLCAMMNIQPAPNNGTWGALHHMLVSPPPDPTTLPVVTPTPSPYPADQATYDDHLQRNGCPLLTGSNDPTIDSTLNLNETSIQQALQTHTPWGAPQTSASNSIRTVVSTDYVSSFDASSGLPLWTAYTLKTAGAATYDPAWRLDVRLEKNDASLCDRLVGGLDANSTLAPLFPFGVALNQNDIAVDTNAVEISTRFAPFWAAFHTVLGQSVASNGETNVMTGPVRDTPSPSLFVIVSNCQNSALAGCPVDQLDVQAFIFPTHPKYNRDCMDADHFIRVHVAMLRDVEQLSGLHFFPSTSYRDQADLLSRTPFASSLLVDPIPDN